MVSRGAKRPATPAVDLAEGLDPASSYALLKLDEASVEILRLALQEHFVSVAAQPIENADAAESRLTKLAHIAELIRLLQDLGENGAAQSRGRPREQDAEDSTPRVGRGLGSLLPSTRDPALS